MSCSESGSSPEPPSSDQSDTASESSYIDSDEGLRPLSESEEYSAIAYSREETIAAFAGYFDFLTTMYLDDDAVGRPPEDGWSDVNAETLAGLGKTDEVVALLRHLPYIRARSDGSTTNAAGYCTFADWAHTARMVVEHGAQYGETEGAIRESVGAEGSVPGHVIGISDSKDMILLDTQLGVVYFHECPAAIATDPDLPFPPLRADDPYDYFPSEEAEWRGISCAWAVSDFFEVMKYLFRELRYVPMSRQIVDEAWMDNPADADTAGARPMVQDIFRQHGWPSLEHYRKRECMEAVEKAVEEKYPGMFFPYH